MRVKHEIIVCNCCKKKSPGVGFNEYQGEKDFAGKSFDLCDECAEKGWFIKRYSAGVVAIEHESQYEPLNEEYEPALGWRGENPPQSQMN